MSKSILIIDDDKLIAITLRRILTMQGYNVTIALSGIKALSIMQRFEFDLIMSDIKMPNMDGVETVKKIREYLSQSRKRPVPEIFITAYAREEVFQRALCLNAAAYIEKPFDVKTLLQTTREVLERQACYN